MKKIVLIYTAMLFIVTSLSAIEAISVQDKNMANDINTCSYIDNKLTVEQNLTLNDATLADVNKIILDNNVTLKYMDKIIERNPAKSAKKSIIKKNK